MNSFIELNEGKYTIKSINLDDYSVEDLEEYIISLNTEKKRANEEIKKRLKSKEEAQKIFK
jgi:uncharacterized small protein (DUF1192 family)